jgi:erythromycin esterase-like protein
MAPEDMLVTAMRTLLLLLIVSGCVRSRPEVSPRSSGSSDLVEEVARDACGKSIVLLGEEGHHASGRTTAFKVELLQRLVDDCHFTAVYFEAGIYDFLKIESRVRDQEPVAPPALAAALMMWHTREMAALLPFLAERLDAGAIRVGGIDDQIGRGSYASRDMVSELVRVVDVEGEAACLEAFGRFQDWNYDDSHPYDPAALARCARDLRMALERRKDEDDLDYLPMATNLERYFERERADLAGAPAASDRDRSMFDNLQWHIDRAPKPTKAIVWLATNHAAKQRPGGHQRGDTLGQLVRARYGSASFALGFSACSGAYLNKGTRQPAPITPAVQGSLEERTCSTTHGPGHYLDAHALEGLGAISARPFNFGRWETATWSQVLDGFVVFREEHPTHPLDPT